MRDLFLVQVLPLLVLHFYLNTYDSSLTTQNFIGNVSLFPCVEIYCTHFSETTFRYKNYNELAPSVLLLKLLHFEAYVNSEVLFGSSVKFYPWKVLHKLLFFFVDSMDYVSTKIQFQTFCKFLIKMWELFTEWKIFFVSAKLIQY